MTNNRQRRSATLAAPLRLRIIRVCLAGRFPLAPEHLRGGKPDRTGKLAVVAEFTVSVHFRQEHLGKLNRHLFLSGADASLDAFQTG
jgi:hypothetical protein